MAHEGYVVLESHRKIHEKLVEDIFKLNQELVEKNTMLEHDLNKFLKHWLVDHIVHCDYDFRVSGAKETRRRRRLLSLGDAAVCRLCTWCALFLGLVQGLIGCRTRRSVTIPAAVQGATPTLTVT
jgi:hypothetical protein